MTVTSGRTRGRPSCSGRGRSDLEHSPLRPPPRASTSPGALTLLPVPSLDQNSCQMPTSLSSRPVQTGTLQSTESMSYAFLSIRVGSQHATLPQLCPGAHHGKIVTGSSLGIRSRSVQNVLAMGFLVSVVPRLYGGVDGECRCRYCARRPRCSTVEIISLCFLLRSATKVDSQKWQVFFLGKSLFSYFHGAKAKGKLKRSGAMRRHCPHNSLMSPSPETPSLPGSSDPSSPKATVHTAIPEKACPSLRAHPLVTSGKTPGRTPACA